MARFYNYEDDSLVSGTNFSDTISNQGKGVTIDAGGGNDQIYNHASGVSISAGDGSDYIWSLYDATTINAGSGIDTITLDGTGGVVGNVIQYALGDGYTFIYNLTSKDLIHITSGTYSTRVVEGHMVIDVGYGGLAIESAGNRKIRIQDSSGWIETINPYGADWIRNEKSNINVVGSYYNDTIRNYGAHVSINTGDGNDNIVNYDDGIYSTIRAGSGNDYISNWQAANISLDAGDGDDEINIGGSNSTVDAGNGNDNIETYGSGKSISINGGSGNDYFRVEGSNVTINGGSGNDVFNFSYVNGSDHLIQYANGDGNDTLRDLRSNDLIHITDENYSLQTIGNNLIISVGDGSMTLLDAANRKVRVKNSSGNIDVLNPDGSIVLHNEQPNVNIVGSSHADTIYNYEASNVSIDGGAGNDWIWITSYYDEDSTISGGDGDDSIHNSGANSTLDGGNGNDYIYNWGDGTSIYGSFDDDTIQNPGDNVTIVGGSGDDSIALYGMLRGAYEDAYSCANVVQYAAGDGKDTIQGIAFTDLIHITEGSYSTQTVDNDLIISVGDGSMVLLGAANRIIRVKDSDNQIQTLNAEGVMYTRNNQSDTTFYGSMHNDTLYNVADYVTLVGDNGDDRIQNGFNAAFSYLDGGEGNDSIENFAADVTINGGFGDDRIIPHQDYYTLTDQKPVTIEYAEGEGNDTIFGYEPDDKIRLVLGYFTGASLDGNDVVISVGEGSIRLTDAKGKQITLVDAYDETIQFTDELSYYDAVGTEGRSLLREQSLKNLDAVRNIGEEEIKNDKTLPQKLDEVDPILKLISKLIKNLTDIDVDAVTDLLVELNDITIATSDISKGNKGMTEINSDLTEIASSLARVSNSIFTLLKDFKGESINLPMVLISTLIEADANMLAFGNSDEITAEQRNELLKSGVVAEGELAKYITKLLGLKTFFKPLGYIDMGVAGIVGMIYGIDQYNASLDEYCAESISSATRDALIDALTTGIHSGYHQLTYGADDIIFKGLKMFGGWAASKITGLNIDLSADERTYMEVLGDAVRSKMNGTQALGTKGNDALSVVEDNAMLNGGTGDDALFLYGASLEIYGGQGNDNIFIASKSNNDTINCGSGSDRVTNYGYNNTIHGGDGNDKIFVFAPQENIGTPRNNLIYGDAGDDQIFINDANNNTVNGGAGNDVITLEEANDIVIICGVGYGKDVVNGYNSSDTINIAHGQFTTLKSGQDVIVDFGDGSLTLRNAKGKTLNIERRDVIERNELEYNFDHSAVKLPAAYTGQLRVLDYDSDVKTIDATEVEQSINIFGNDLDNVIDGSTHSDIIYGGNGNDKIHGNGGDDKLYGDSGNDTLDGGDGNDTLYGSRSSDTFVFAPENGNDIIADYSIGQDKIKLSVGTIDNATFNGNDVILHVGNNSITVKGARGKKLTIIQPNDQTFEKIYDLPDETPRDTVEIENVKLNKAQTTLKLKSKFSGTVDAATISDNIKTINASSNKNVVNLIGNDNDNVIKASKGGSTLNGGAGNDKLYGHNNGTDVFIFDGRGNDTINKYKPGQDTVRIVDGEPDGVTVKGSNVILSINDGTLMVKGVAKKELTLTDSDGNANVYKFTKTNNTFDTALVLTNPQLPANEYVENYWFTCDHIATDDNLTSILNDDFNNITDETHLNDCLGAQFNLTLIPMSSEKTFSVKSAVSCLKSIKHSL